MPAHVKKGDTVYIRSGDHKGMTGEVIRVITKSQSVVIKGINLRTKHLRASQANPTNINMEHQGSLRGF
jgi:large subunit ribosomal protein L24